MSFLDRSSDDIFLPSGRLRLDLFHESTIQVLHHARAYAEATYWDSIRSPHLFMGLLAAPDASVRSWAKRLGADPPRLLDQFRELFQQDEPLDIAPVFLNREFLSDNVIKLLRQAYNRCLDHQRNVITPADLLIILFTTPHSIVAECFERIGVTAAKLTELAVMAEQQMYSR